VCWSYSAANPIASPGRWQYYGGRRNPLDSSTPARTVEASGVSVRLFDAALADGSRVLLKEYLGDEARGIGERELAIYKHLDASGGFANLDVGAPPRCAQLRSQLPCSRMPSLG